MGGLVNLTKNLKKASVKILPNLKNQLNESVAARKSRRQINSELLEEMSLIGVAHNYQVFNRNIEMMEEEVELIKKTTSQVPLTAKKSVPSQHTIHTTATKDQTDRRCKKLT